MQEKFNQPSSCGEENNVKHFRTQTDGETDGKDREREEQINRQTDIGQTDPMIKKVLLSCQFR